MLKINFHLFEMYLQSIVIFFELVGQSHKANFMDTDLLIIFYAIPNQLRKITITATYYAPGFK